MSEETIANNHAAPERRVIKTRSLFFYMAIVTVLSLAIGFSVGFALGTGAERYDIIAPADESLNNVLSGL